MENLTWETQTLTHPTAYDSSRTYDVLYSHSNTVEHGVVDAKGRAIGGFAVVRSEPLNAKGESVFWSREPLPVVRTEYRLEICATRNGKSFGAIRRPTKYDTLEAAQAAAVGKLIEQGKRYIKQFGG